MPTFVTIPLKKSADLDVVDPIKRFVSAMYSNADKPEDPQAIMEFQKLRNQAVIRPLDKHENSLEVLYRYADQLTAIEGKLPFSPAGICLSFKWKDAFDRGSLLFGKASVTLTVGGYEKACVLFNVGALQSQIAAAQPLDNDGELKLAAKMFQQAAGTFSYLKDNVMGFVGQDSTCDLMPDTLSALCSLMVAQAQESIFLKAARDKMKPGNVAKIANQCAEFYMEAHKQMGRDGLRGLWEKDWLGQISAKQQAFTGLAHYYESLVCKDEKEIGPELAHLTKAQDLLSAGIASQLYPSELATAQRAYQVAKKDNDFIYHERIPDVKTLPAIGKAPLAKPLPPSHPMSRGFKDLFGHLVPLAVQQAIAVYETKRTEIVNGETSRMREGTTLMNGILASLNLPAALEDYCNHEAIPLSVKEKATEVRNAGGIGTIQSMIHELPSLLQRNKEILDETVRLLNEEKASDDQLRAQFKEKWTRMASERLTEPLWQEIGKYKGILDTAQSADGIVRQKFDANRRGIEQLSKSEAELRQAIPGLGAGGTQGEGASSGPVQKLKQQMNQVENIKSDRASLEEELKQTNFDMTTDFLRAMAESGAINDQQLSTDKLNELFTPIRERVSASLKQQGELMQEVQQTNMGFTQMKGSAGGDRERFLKELAAAYDAFVELKSHLQEGTKFYNDLTPLLVRLQQKVSDFCFARKTEKEELMKDLQQNIVSSAASSPPEHPSTQQKQTPPARPPPPRPAGPTPAAPPPNMPPATAANPYPTYPGAYPAYNPYVYQAPLGQAPAYPPYQGYGQPPPPQQGLQYGAPGGYNPYPPQPYNPYGQAPPYPTQNWGGQPQPPPPGQ